MYVWVAGWVRVGVKTSATQRRTEGLKIQGEGHKTVKRCIFLSTCINYEDLDLNTTLQRHFLAFETGWKKHSAYERIRLKLLN